MPKIRIRLHSRLVFLLWVAASVAFGAEPTFEGMARRTLGEIHAQSFQAGKIAECVALYAPDASVFVDHQRIARGTEELLAFYRGLREHDRILTIEVDEFVEIGNGENTGWALFKYTKEFDLRDRDPEQMRRYQLEGVSRLKTRQYGTAIFTKVDGQWRIQVMSVFDPEIWERIK